MTDEEILALVHKAENQPVKKQKKFSHLIVLLCIILAVVYTGICLIMQYQKGVSPNEQLTICVFSFISVELWSLSKIKREESKKGTVINNGDCTR